MRFDLTTLRHASLLRRLTLTLLTAFALIWVVQLGLIFVQASSEFKMDAALKSRAEALIRALAPINDNERANVAMATADALLNRSTSAASTDSSVSSTPSVIGLVLLDATGRVVYASAALDLNATADQIAADSRHWGSRHGTQWRMHHASDSRWRVVVGETVLDPWWLIGAINARMAPYVGLSLVLVLLPMWWALALGLRPLQRLSRLIFAREPSDLSPLNFAAPQAELRPLVAELERLLAGLRRKVEREHAFVHDAAHELRTPLAAVSLHGFGVVHAQTNDQRELARVGLQSAIARSSRVIEQLLQLAALEQGAVSVKSDAIDLARLVREAVAMQMPAAMQRHLQVQLIGPDRLMACVDRAAFGAIVHNLMANSIAYVPSSVDAPGHVEIELSEGDGTLTLSVADDGFGVAEQDREALFERFRRGGGAQALSATGSGLGLAIVKQASLRLGGDAMLSDGLIGANRVGLRVSTHLPKVRVQPL